MNTAKTQISLNHALDSLSTTPKASLKALPESDTRITELLMSREAKAILDSEKRTAIRAIEKAELASWSEKSVLRTDSGDLKIMYHGTGSEKFENFISWKPCFFSEDKKYAEVYMDKGGSNSRMISVYLNIEKPFNTATDERAREIYNQEFIPYWSNRFPNASADLKPLNQGEPVHCGWGNQVWTYLRIQQRENSKSMGYDGLVVDEKATAKLIDSESLNSYVPLNPSQIKIVKEHFYKLTETNDLAKEKLDRKVEIKSIPDSVRTAEMCLASVKLDGNSIKNFSREERTPEVCAAALAQNPKASKHLTDGQVRSAEEFKKLSAKESQNSDVSYKGKHMAPLISSGAPIHNLSNQEFGIYPEDVYSKNASKMYGTFGKNEEAFFRKLQSLKDSPEKMVDIYRAIPNEVFEKVGNTINHGDWVTIEKSYAKFHGEARFKGESFSIQKDTVPAKALYTDGNSIYEYGLDRVAGKIELTAPAQSQQQEVPTVQSNVTAQAKPEAKEAPKHEVSSGPTDASRQQAQALAAKLEASRAC